MRASDVTQSEQDPDLPCSTPRQGALSIDRLRLAHAELIIPRRVAPLSAGRVLLEQSMSESLATCSAGCELDDGVHVSDGTLDEIDQLVIDTDFAALSDR